MPTILNNGIQLPDKGSVDWYSSMQSNYNLIDTHLGNTDAHVTAEDKANWNSKQGSLSQAQLDAIAQVATNTNDIATLQSGKADVSHTHSSSDITDIDDYATKDYVDNSISGLVDNAPDALNTLNELSAALNDDSNFASTVTTALASKANSSDLATVATSGSYDDLTDTPTIPTNTSDLTNDSNFVVSSDLATVATSGDYDDLSNKPSIPTNTSDLNNDSGFVTLNDFDIPAKTSDLTNDSGFITSSDVPTSTSDLINDSNFVDTSNSAVASGITSAKVTEYDSHIADTDIHVTTTDKNRWNNNTYVFRYSSTALTASSTNSNTLLDNTDNLKVGDKVIDSNGVLFSITAIDTANSTFTIGTALIDLAQDSNVVHKSGVETVTGFKEFANIRATNSIKGINLDSTTTDLNNCYSDFAPYGENKGGNIQYYYCNTDAGTANISNLPEAKAFVLTSITTRLISNSLYVKQILINSNSKTFVRYCNNSTWSSWVNETDSEYVHKSGDETISGDKVFNDRLIKNIDVVLGTTPSTGKYGKIEIADNNKNSLLQVTGGVYDNGNSYTRFLVQNKTADDGTGLSPTGTLRDCGFIINLPATSTSDGQGSITPRANQTTDFGLSGYQWRNVWCKQLYLNGTWFDPSAFVTTDTAQTVSGNKTFSSNVNVYNSDSATDTANIILKNSKAEIGTEFSEQSINFVDKNNNPLAKINCYGSSGNFTRLYITAYDANNNSEGFYIRKSPTGTSILPTTAAAVRIGNDTFPFLNLQTRRVNDLEPSSLSLPSGNASDVIDISSYITDLSGAVNLYTVPANGYLTFTFSNGARVQIYPISGGGVSSSWVSGSSAGIIRGFMPVLKNSVLRIVINATTMESFYFIPCQGNV